jgi:hypothetical protein
MGNVSLRFTKHAFCRVANVWFAAQKQRETLAYAGKQTAACIPTAQNVFFL